jgi:hypothetical protein
LTDQRKVQRIGVLTLFTLGTLICPRVLAQAAKTLPGGAVMKPEHPQPPRPLQPSPNATTNAPANGGARPPDMPPYIADVAALIGTFSGTTKADFKVHAQCQAVAMETWIHCDVQVEHNGGALVAVGYDEGTRSYRAFVGNSSGKSTIYRGKLKGKKLVFSGPQHFALDLGSPQQVVFSSVSEVVTLVRDR